MTNIDLRTFERFTSGLRDISEVVSEMAKLLTDLAKAQYNLAKDLHEFYEQADREGHTDERID